MKKWIALALLIPSLVHAAEALTCGGQGSVPERIRDCANRVENHQMIPVEGKIWNLVLQDSKGEQIWKDETGRRLWSSPMRYHGSADINLFKYFRKACQNNRGLSVKDQLSGLEWDIPRKSETGVAIQDGLCKIFESIEWEGMITRDRSALGHIFRTHWGLSSDTGCSVFDDDGFDQAAMGIQPCVASVR